MMYPLRGGCLSNELTVLGREIAVAKRDDVVTAERAAPQWTIFRPAFWACEHPFNQALGHPAVVNPQRQIFVDKRIGHREPLPSRSHISKAINNPLVEP